MKPSVNGHSVMQKQIAKFLEGVGFKGLTLVKGEGNTYSFKFVSADVKGLVKIYGEPTLAGKGTVKVFNCKPYGRIGISNNGFVRMVYEGRVEEEFKDKSHLGNPEVALKYTPALKLLFDKATISINSKLKYVTAVWDYFNKLKFQGRMDKPRLSCGPQPDFGGGKYRKAHGLYQGGYEFTPGKLWINDKLFNSDIDFVNAVIVHEMCITGDALIPTDVGLVRMSQIEKAGASKVATMTGTARIERWWCSGEQPTRKITTVEGSSLRLTGNHPVRVLNSSAQLEWKNAEDLKPGDYLVRRLGTSSITRSAKLPLVEAAGYVKLATERFPSEVTAELARLLGYLTAEGTFIDKANPNTVGFFNKDKALIDDYVRCWAACFGYKPSVTCNANNGLYSVVQTRKDVATWLDGIGFKRGKAPTKQIPWCILRGTSNMQLQFLKAFCEGDAYLSPGGKFQIKVASRKLIRQLSVMLTALGLPNISGSHIGKYGFKPGQRYYTLRLHDGALSSKAIGAVSPRRNTILKSATRYHSSKQQHQLGKHWKIPYVGALLKDQGLQVRAQKDGGLYPWAVAEICEVTKGLRKQLKHLRGSFLFEKVESNKPTGKVEKVYDMTTSAGEFVANGLVIHNCHQAVWVIDNSKDMSMGGHGAPWQAWMRRVGLPPNRYDSTDQVLYMTDSEKALKENKTSANWGPPVTAVEMKKYEAVSSTAAAAMKQKVYLLYERRLFVGKVEAGEFSGIPLKVPQFPGLIRFSVRPTTKFYRLIG